MYEYKAYITHVVDGDTIDAVVDLGFRLTSEIRLRLLGINTPEIFGAEKDLGMIAKGYVTERLLGQNVIIRTQKSDVFGRWLAEVYLNGINVNQELLDKGYAQPYVK